LITLDGAELEDGTEIQGRAFSVERLALYLSRPALQWEFRPSSPWVGTDAERPLPPAPSSQGSLSDLQYAFCSALEEVIGEAESVAVAVSGGLDSAAVLYWSHRIAARRQVKILVLTIPLTDDMGRSNVEVVRQLRDALAPSAEIVYVRAADGREAWDPRGPGFDAMPSLRRAENELARQHGAEVVITGVGADELLGTPRYLLPYLMLRPRDALRYMRDLRGVSRAGAALLEVLGTLGLLLPRRLSTKLYWAASNPEVCGVEPSPLLAEAHCERVRTWTSDWIDQAIRTSSRQRTWAARDGFDAIYPYELLPAAGSVPEVSPFLVGKFVSYARGLPLACRFEGHHRTSYHRRKAILLRLIPSDHWPVLPRQKQIFFNEIAAHHAPIDVHAARRCGELGLIDPRATEADLKSRMMVAALEAWIRGAEARGAVAV
jgi:asparagine synthase (glutamine-hydrolysing)